MDAAQLAHISRLLDQALDLDTSARESWLAGLSGNDASLAPRLRELLAQPETLGVLARDPVAALAREAGAASGERVGPYRLICELGQGGMGSVWLAERSDGTLKRRVALKLPHASWAPGLAERFAREREILSALEHPHIARLYDAGLDAQGRPYMALEYVEGQPIDQYCTKRGLDVQDRVALLLQVADAVAFAHSRLVIHRDLKPGNILVTADGQVRLLDFGIAKLVQGNEGKETELTRLAGRALTLDYASPEQIRGEAIGTASDVYSLGVVAYELLAGAKPYRLKRGSAAELEEAIALQDVALASVTAAPTLKQHLRGDLDAIVNRALKKDPAERYPTVDALAQDLRRHLDGQRVMARPDTFAYRLSRLVRRHRIPLAAGTIVVAAFALAVGAGATALVVGALLLGLAAALWQARQARVQASIARTEARTAEAVQDFLQGIFRANSGEQDDPVKARQRTAKELLDEGAARIEDALDDAPAAKMRVLQTLAQMYHDMFDPGRTVELNRRRIEVAVRAFGAKSLEVLRGRITLGICLTDIPDFAAARAELERAATLIDGGLDPGARLRAEYHTAWAIVLIHDAMVYDPARALAEADLALALLREQPPSQPLVGALHMRATALQLLGRPRESVAAIEEALALVRADPTFGRNSQVQFLWELGDSRLDLDEPDLAENAYREALALAARQQGADGALVMWTRIVFIRFLVKQSRLREAAELTTRIRAQIDAWPDTPERRSVTVGLLRFPIQSLLRLGRLDEAADVITAAEAISLDPDHDVAGTWDCLARRAWLEIERGDFATARRALAAADALVESRDLEADPRADAYRTLHIRLALASGDSADESVLGKLGLSALDEATVAALPIDRAPPGVELLLRKDPRAAGAATARLLEGAARQARHADAAADLHALQGNALLILGDARGAATALAEAERRMRDLLDDDASPRLMLVRSRLGLALLACGDDATARRLADVAGAMRARRGALGPQYERPLAELREAIAGSV